LLTSYRDVDRGLLVNCLEISGEAENIYEGAAKGIGKSEFLHEVGFGLGIAFKKSRVHSGPREDYVQNIVEAFRCLRFDLVLRVLSKRSFGLFNKHSELVHKFVN
jgi:hypothetical protein